MARNGQAYPAFYSIPEKYGFVKGADTELSSFSAGEKNGTPSEVP